MVDFTPGEKVFVIGKEVRGKNKKFSCHIVYAAYYLSQYPGGRLLLRLVTNFKEVNVPLSGVFKSSQEANNQIALRNLDRT